MKDIFVSSSPHIHSPEDTPWIMRQVIYALIPGALIGVYFFGIPAIRVIAISVVSCMVIETLWQKLMKQDITIADGSAALTGLLLAMNLPSGAPWWLVVLGSLVAIILGKQVYGGLGNNPFNPALVARVFLLISFPVHMTTWPAPRAFFSQAADTVTGATPLGALKTAVFEHGTITAAPHLNLMDPFFGNIGGSLGEISALALILGGIYLIARKIISWHIPVIYIGTVAVFTGALWMMNPNLYADPAFHLIAGGLMLGAFFMATDMVTSPITNKGKIIFAVGCGVITVVIRIWGGYPEGVSFAILIMNALVPLINKVTRPGKFGAV
ncbi:MAG TPA: RnfABCDGE type electron transport complex subunit D [Deltaproteobacteria bacterium]|nr:RnfABCDGE type electron transport complex subunit D [Deltaproteobacteria bacterium]HPJ93155.1 RnfABCDGE type electron transport complex subunit D [Deltaproteobacteria bacterium]HPR52107.1 RnfABCDGE type electron transport complex subunit D [Deltaproteobacteria bacterium]